MRKKRNLIVICSLCWCLVAVISACTCFACSSCNKNKVDDSSISSVEDDSSTDKTHLSATEQNAEALLNDDLAKVTIGTSQELLQISDSEWTDIVQSSQPLSVGETYVEDWSNNTTQMRLKPYETVTIPDELPGATFEYVQTVSGKAVKLTTNGAVGGQFDYIGFAGMRYVEDALYSVVVNYTVLTENRSWKVGFEHNYFMDLSAGMLGEKKQATGEFTATSASGYNNNLNYSLLFMVNGGTESAQLQIDKITITRLEDRPSIKNAKISGTYAVGGRLTLSYDVIVGNRLSLTHTDINWFITTNTDCTDITVLNEYDGNTSITIPSTAYGKYIGCILKPYSNASGSSGIGENKIIIGKAVGDIKKFSVFKFKKVGDTYTETFDDLDGSYNVGIKADTGVDAYVTGGTNAINGKSLYINNKTTETKGGYLTGMKFVGGVPYNISFKLKLLQKPTELYIQFRALSSLGYSGDVKYQVILPAMTNGGTYECYIPALKLYDASDYQMQIFTVGKGEFLIDDLTLKMLSSSGEINTLKTLGGSMTEDFDTKNMLTNIDTFGWGGITTTEGFDGCGLLIESKTSDATTLYFYDFIGKLSIGATYEVTFEYMIISNNAPQEMYIGFRSMEDGYQTNTKLDFSKKTKDQKYIWSGSFTLPNKEDMFLKLFNMSGDGSQIIIDNITIKKTA